MISYPGEVLARFGRYEAVEDIGSLERGHLWRAWDPFLERFVIVAALPDVDATELFRGLPKLEDSLHGWFGGEDPSSILDFGPATRNHAAYFVFRMPVPAVEGVGENGAESPALPEEAATSFARSQSPWREAVARAGAWVQSLVSGPSKKDSMR